MAQTATVYNFEVTLSNVDRGVYETLKLSLARHPSETIEYLMTRLLAYCLEFQEGITFSKGLFDSDEPAVWAHDLTGKLLLWIEVGSPSAQRLHKASKRGARVVVYAHKDPTLLLSQLSREEIFEVNKIKIYGFEQGFLEDLCQVIEKRTALTISISEKQLYINILDKSFETAVVENTVITPQA